MNGFNGIIYNEIFTQINYSRHTMAFLDVDACVYIYDQCCKCVDWNSILFIHIKMGIRKTLVIKVSMDISRESPEKLVKAANIIFV